MGVFRPVIFLAREWGYLPSPSRLLPYYRKSETDMDIQDDFHGAEGPLPIVRREKEEWPEVQRAFYQACMERGYPPNHDLNGPNSGGQFPYRCGPSR